MRIARGFPLGAMDILVRHAEHRERLEELAAAHGMPESVHDRGAVIIVGRLCPAAGSKAHFA